MVKKILFIQPTIYDDEGKLVKKKKLYFVGMAYPLLAAMLPDDWEAEICLETIEEIPFDTDASVIGIGGMGHACVRSRELGKIFKSLGKTVIMGGPMASLVPELAKEYFDSIVIGDAENVWRDVIKDIENGELKEYYKMPLTKLTTPVPRYDLVVNKNIGDFLPVQAGRGCPNICKFCSIYCMYRTLYLKRDIAEVIRDIKYVKSLGFKKFLLIDDNIVSDVEYMTELCEEIKKLKMKWMSQCAINIAKEPRLLKLAAESGCYMLSFGLESLNKESLSDINKEQNDPSEYLDIIKTVNKAGIEVASEMIVGIDSDTEESLLDTVKFISKSGIIAPKFYIYTPIPGTDLYNEMKEANRIVEEDVFKFKPSLAVILHPNMTTERLNGVYWIIYRKVYTIRKILRRTLLSKKMFRHPFRCMFFFSVNMFYRYQIKRKIAPNIF